MQHRFKILCVDDDLGFRRYLSKSLDEMYQIKYFALGFECLASSLTWDYDLILIDATLPDMVSEHLVHKLKGIPELAATPIVIVSYKDSEKERTRFAKCGCDHFLSKVASPQDIKSMLATVINQAA
jgi:two-component system sensor histidine kinase and response regulator WspE